MAKIIVLSDIHGNLAALEAAWRDIGGRPFDALYCLGDLAAFVFHYTGEVDRPCVAAVSEPPHELWSP